MNNNLLQEIQQQSAEMGWNNFVCQSCMYYLGNMKCKYKIFIAFTGADMSRCRFYRKGTLCIHCGKRT